MHILMKKIAIIQQMIMIKWFIYQPCQRIWTTTTDSLPRSTAPSTNTWIPKTTTSRLSVKRPTTTSLQARQSRKTGSPASRKVSRLSFAAAAPCRDVVAGLSDCLLQSVCKSGSHKLSVIGIKSSYNIGGMCRETQPYFNPKKRLTLYDQTGKRWCKIGSRQSKRHQSENYADRRSSNYNNTGNCPYFGTSSKFANMNGKQVQRNNHPTIRATLEYSNKPFQNIQASSEVFILVSLVRIGNRNNFLS